MGFKRGRVELVERNYFSVARLSYNVAFFGFALFLCIKKERKIWKVSGVDRHATREA